MSLIEDAYTNFLNLKKSYKNLIKARDFNKTRIMGDSLENPDTSTDQNVVIVEYNAFANYLRRAVTILLPEEDSLMPPALNVALEDPSNQDYIRKFLCDSQIQALYIQRSCMKGTFFLIRFFCWV